jgi:hypothetical protein
MHGVDRRNLPLNHKADAAMGATISEDRNQDGAARAASFNLTMIEAKRSSAPDGRWLAAGEVIGSTRYQPPESCMKRL